MLRDSLADFECKWTYSLQDLHQWPFGGIERHPCLGVSVGVPSVALFGLFVGAPNVREFGLGSVT